MASRKEWKERRQPRRTTAVKAEETMPKWDKPEDLSKRLLNMNVSDPRTGQALQDIAHILQSLEDASDDKQQEESFETCDTQASNHPRQNERHGKIHSEEPARQLERAVSRRQSPVYHHGRPVFIQQPMDNQRFPHGGSPTFMEHQIGSIGQWQQGTYANLQATECQQYQCSPVTRQMTLYGTTNMADEMSQVAEQLMQVINRQLSAQRVNNLKKIKVLNGYEGQISLGEFFEQFERATRGAADDEMIEMLQSKCRGRAKRLIEEMQQAKHWSYFLLKEDFSRQIMQASTEQRDALRMLSSRMFRSRSEPLRVYAERIIRTVKKAFPSTDNLNREPLLHHYFMEGLRDVHLKTFLVANRGVPFEEKMAGAIRLENRLYPGRYTSEEREDYRQRSPQQGIFDFGASRQQGHINLLGFGMHHGMARNVSAPTFEAPKAAVFDPFAEFMASNSNSNTNSATGSSTRLNDMSASAGNSGRATPTTRPNYNYRSPSL